jgi:hypothetical protein
MSAGPLTISVDGDGRSNCVDTVLKNLSLQMFRKVYSSSYGSHPSVNVLTQGLLHTCSHPHDAKELTPHFY